MVYYNVKETAAQWKISPQMVRRFCLDGRVTGAVLTDKGCSSCAAIFYHSPTRKIYRADPIQVHREMCDCCRTRRGYDFVIAPRYKR